MIKRATKHKSVAFLICVGCSLCTRAAVVHDQTFMDTKSTVRVSHCGFPELCEACFPHRRSRAPDFPGLSLCECLKSPKPHPYCPLSSKVSRRGGLAPLVRCRIGGRGRVQVVSAFKGELGHLFLLHLGLRSATNEPLDLLNEIVRCCRSAWRWRCGRRQ